MSQSAYEKISRSPKFQELVRQRSRLAIILSVIMLVIYFGFILLVAFGKELLATPLGSGVTTWGIPIGFGVIIFTIVVTAIYVRRANSEFDALSDQIKQGR